MTTDPADTNRETYSPLAGGVTGLSTGVFTARRGLATLVVAATKNEVDFFELIDDVGIIDRRKTFSDADERRARECESRAVMQDRFVEPHPDDQETHLSLEE